METTTGEPSKPARRSVVRIVCLSVLYAFALIGFLAVIFSFFMILMISACSSNVRVGDESIRGDMHASVSVYNPGASGNYSTTVTVTEGAARFDVAKGSGEIGAHVEWLGDDRLEVVVMHGRPFALRVAKFALSSHVITVEYRNE